MSPQGQAIASLSSTDPAALAPPDGPVCVREAGTYRLVVSVPASDASSSEMGVAVQIWRTATD
jgi:hypothetical protein